MYIVCSLCIVETWMAKQTLKCPKPHSYTFALGCASLFFWSVSYVWVVLVFLSLALISPTSHILFFTRKDDWLSSVLVLGVSCLYPNVETDFPWSLLSRHFPSIYKFCAYNNDDMLGKYLCAIYICETMWWWMDRWIVQLKDWWADRKIQSTPLSTLWVCLVVFLW